VKSVRGVAGAHRDISSDVPQVSVKGQPGPGGAVRPQAGRRAPGRGHRWWPLRRSGVIFPGRQGLRHGRLEPGIGPGAASATWKTWPIDTPAGRGIRLARFAKCLAAAKIRTPSERQGDSRYLDVGARCLAGSRAVVNGHQAEAGLGPPGSRLPHELLGEYKERQARRAAAAVLDHAGV